MTETSLKIRFVITGATPAGLAAAVSLRQAGHSVVLLEVEDPRADVSLLPAAAVLHQITMLAIGL